MAYKRKPLYHFRDATEIGVNKIPLKKIITVEDTNLIYIKDNNIGLVDGSTIQVAIDNDNLVLIVGGSGSPAALVSLTRVEQIAIAGQDTFNVTYEPGLIEVAVNGLILSPSDWTEDAGTTIVLDIPLVVDDEVLFTTYGLFADDGFVKTDGSRDMDAGYVPTNDLSVATKLYVDNNAGGGGGSNIVHADANYSALSNDLIVLASDGIALAVDETAYTITLPVAPADKDIIRFMDGSGNSQNRPVLVDRNGNNIDDIDEDLTLDVNYFDIKLVFNAADSSWALGGK